MKKFLDLRCSRRLTLEEGRFILYTLEHFMGSPVQSSATGKIVMAIKLATHKCIGAKCRVCGGSTRRQKVMRERRVKAMIENAVEMKNAASEELWVATREVVERRPVLKIEGRPVQGSVESGPEVDGAA